ncbi:DUF4136 domain-containing protein [Flavihumibacter rivuli]|uniref:DUF4136 domain-containing protein n=1 Tax=Flavihumibacter rivuli TaxID=2838156 RepID=UPI001BDEBC41|nr:DUF4136 domain-containing protein [Flavihumibacter rivuli]ULQ58105.1 DUF4136 domain-containing protein [Flavihumibacter rivuli]
MKRILYLSLLVASVVSCRKSPDTSELKVNFAVATSKDATANFGNYKTYHISDTISLRTTNPQDTVWSDADAKRLIDAVKAEMADRGYTLVQRGSRPDIGIAFTAIKNLNLGVIYPGWWWGYWGCYWYYCGYPPYYPYYGVVYSIPTGTLVLDMIDLKNAQVNNKLTVIWGSVMSGGLGYTNDDIELGIDAINQSFEQSPYIQTN